MQWWPQQKFTTNRFTPGATEVIDMVLDPVRFGTVTRTVVDAVTNEPLGNVDGGWPRPWYRPFRSAADGHFTLPNVRLSQTPRRRSASAPTTPPRTGPRASASTFRPARRASTSRCPCCAVPRTPPSWAPWSRRAHWPRIGGATVRGTGYGLPSTTTAADGSFSLSFPPQDRENSPYRVTLEASAPGFNPNAPTSTSSVGHNWWSTSLPPPGYGTVTGTVRDNTGAGAGNIFVGSSWGGATRTTPDGTYTLTGAPSKADGTARSWIVTAVPPSDGQLLPASAPISVAAGQSAQADPGVDTPATWHRRRTGRRSPGSRRHRRPPPRGRPSP